MSPSKRYDRDLLRRIRNEISTEELIRRLEWPWKIRDGRFAFLCPTCGETESAVNSRTNLARCFHCDRNYNPIDFVIRVHDLEFLEAVEFLISFLSD